MVKKGIKRTKCAGATIAMNMVTPKVNENANFSSRLKALIKKTEVKEIVVDYMDLEDVELDIDRIVSFKFNEDATVRSITYISTEESVVAVVNGKLIEKIIADLPNWEFINNSSWNIEGKTHKGVISDKEEKVSILKMFVNKPIKPKTIIMSKRPLDVKNRGHDKRAKLEREKIGNLENFNLQNMLRKGWDISI